MSAPLIASREARSWVRYVKGTIRTSLASLILACPLASLHSASLAGPGEPQILSKTVQGRFADVLEGVTAAIQGHGLNITQVIPADEILSATQGDSDPGPPVFHRARTVEFCSPRLSLRLVREDPRFLVLCPFAISLFELSASPGRVTVSYRNPGPAAKPRPGPALNAAKTLMDEPVTEGTQWFAPATPP